MNIINKLTLRHLKENKRRTLVTIIGIIISVAMITSVTTLAASFLDLMKRSTIAQNGEWHFYLQDVNKEQIEAIKQDEATTTVVLSNQIGYALLEDSKNKYKPYFIVKEYNEQGFKQFPFELNEGRLPEAADEIVIPKDLETNGGIKYEVGDQLTIDVGERYAMNEDSARPLGQTPELNFLEDGTLSEILKNTEKKTYTIVGKVDHPAWETWEPGYTIFSYFDENLVSSENTFSAFVAVKEVNQSIYNLGKSLAIEIGIEPESVSYNNQLLSYYGVSNDDNIRTTLVSLSAIIISVIVIGSIALIYNAFAISISERARHLGMLSSVGATKKQKRNSVLFEGMVVGLISIPLGILAGLGGLGITFSIINSLIQNAFDINEKLTIIVTPISILAASGVSLVTIFISSYLPARKASKISAMDAIRQNQDVKLTGKKVKTSKLVRKMFGIQAEIGLKNLKRNKKRYQVTVFSLVISIVLFLTISFFSNSLQKSVELAQGSINYDIQVQTTYENEEELKSFAALDNVTEYSIVNSTYLNSWIDMDKVPGENIQSDSSLNKDGKKLYGVFIQALDKASFEAYANSVGADIEKFKDTDHPTAIVIDTFVYQNFDNGKITQEKSIYTDLGDKFDLIQQDFETEQETFVNSIEIAAITDQYPMGNSTAGFGTLTLVVPESLFEQLVLQDEYQYQMTDLFLNSSDPMKTQTEIEELSESNLFISNIFSDRQRAEQLVLLLKVFIYGFTVLITAISVANIFNTISTSIALRKREFAMLKSVGMTPKEFNKMINYESIFYGIKSLLYGLPISVAIMYLIYTSLMNTFSYDFSLPWMAILFTVIAIFMIVGAAMLYASSKVKKENIIDALKMENI
ncbi:ABC transporter permease [Chengkuizengella axinellae]|uniref:ABC transporter permease n=1 Tax=Chengkuizengella axinellae TaxID=3064388 RepID=A0ABT9J402_9BACL|nr:ABC transporter permease [Chengkuizengella sp. 2205SS18-9]MDP5276334.1 ABC transporter permease [Chengkuizengella sp. 2205SS18-9]